MFETNVPPHVAPYKTILCVHIKKSMKKKLLSASEMCRIEAILTRFTCRMQATSALFESWPCMLHGHLPHVQPGNMYVVQMWQPFGLFWFRQVPYPLACPLHWLPIRASSSIWFLRYLVGFWGLWSTTPSIGFWQGSGWHVICMAFKLHGVVLILCYHSRKYQFVVGYL